MKSDSLGTKSRRKRLWDYLCGCGLKQTFSAECHSVGIVVRGDCSGDGKVLTKLDSNKIEVIVLDDQKSRELRRIRMTCTAVFLYDVVNKYM